MIELWIGMGVLLMLFLLALVAYGLRSKRLSRWVIQLLDGLLI